MSEFTMPSLGADMEFGTLQEWLVRPGDHVERGDLMAVVDTDKAAVEVETFEGGVVDSLLVEPGQRVPVGTPLATLAPVGTWIAPTPDVVPAAAAPAAAPPPVTPPVRHHAAELGVDLAAITGTGKGGRITRHDVDRAAAAAPAPAEPVPAGPAGPRSGGSAPQRHAAPGLPVRPAAGRRARGGPRDGDGHRPGGAIRADDVRAAAPVAPAAEAAPHQPRRRLPRHRSRPRPGRRPAPVSGPTGPRSRP